MTHNLHQNAMLFLSCSFLFAKCTRFILCNETTTPRLVNNEVLVFRYGKIKMGILRIPGGRAPGNWSLKVVASPLQKHSASSNWWTASIIMLHSVNGNQFCWQCPLRPAACLNLRTRIKWKAGIMHVSTNRNALATAQVVLEVKNIVRNV